jgi:hypothetical protein
MDLLSLIIVVIALVIAVAASIRTGGLRELKHQVQAPSSTTAFVRDGTADALNRLEPVVRGQGRPRPGEPSAPPTRTDTR